MSSLSQFGGRQPTKSIVNYYSAGGLSQPNVATGNEGRHLLSGALDVNTLKPLVTISTPGAMPVLAIWSDDATPRTLRIKVTVDGVVAFDATSPSIAARYTGMKVADGFPIIWNSSLLVEVASSLAETNKVVVGYVAHT